MSFRRFLYLVADDCLDRSYSLRRIDMSRFFFRASTEGTPAPLDSTGAGAVDPSAVEDGGRLPDPAIDLCPPHLGHRVGTMNFMLLKNKSNDGEEGNKVVAIDNMGRSLMVDPDLSPTVRVRALPSVASSKFAPFSLTVGQNLYVMDAYRSGGKHHSFEVLSSDAHRSFRCNDWQWQPLDPPPNAGSPAGHCHSIDSYTVVAGSKIAVSNKASKRTYSFDTVNKTWNKAGNWVLPFNSFAEYVPKQKLWFGISPVEDGYCFSAANLVVSSDSNEMRMPVVHGLWKEYAEPLPEWRLARSYAVHLGSSKFCITRFFDVGKIYVCLESHTSYMREEELQVTLTGVEVEGCGEGLRVVKHKSERYKLDVAVDYRVL